MKLSLERAALLKALGHIQSVVEKRSTLAILSNVLLQASQDGLTLVATDMDIEVREVVRATIEREGAVTTPAHMLYDIVRKLPDGVQISLEATPQALTLSAGRSRFRLGGLPIEDFPQIPVGDLSVSFTLAAFDLRTLLDRTRFAMSTEETRYYLNGVYFHTTEVDGALVLRAVATDGHRLARVEVPAPEGTQGMPSVIVPRKTVVEIRKLLDETTGSLKVSLSDSKIRFQSDDIIMTSKLVDGTFPDYQRVIPVNNDTVLEVNARALATAVDLVATVVTDLRTRSVRLALGDGRIMLTANASETATAAEEIEATYSGAPMELGFNARYLSDILAQIEGDTVRFLLSDSTGAVIVRDVMDNGALYVLMPLRV